MQLFLVSPEKEIHLKKEMHYLSHEYNEDTFPKTGKKKQKAKTKKEQHYTNMVKCPELL